MNINASMQSLVLTEIMPNAQVHGLVFGKKYIKCMSASG